MPGLSLGLGLGLQRRATVAGGGPTPDPLALSGTPVTTATEDEAYDGFTVSASGGTAPYTYSLVGTWPAGISINSSTGAVTGTPTESGSFTGLSVRVTDSASDTDDLDTFTLTVEAGVIGLTEVSTHNTNGVIGTSAITASSKSLGATDPTRRIWLSLAFEHSSATRTLDTLTVGGQSATRVVRRAEGASTRNTEIWVIDAGAGSPLENATSADIVATFSGNNVLMILNVYRSVGASATASAINSGTTSASVTIPPGGGALVAANNNNTNAIALSNVSEDLNELCATAFGAVMGSKISVAGENLTSTLSGTTTSPAVVAAALQRA